MSSVKMKLAERALNLIESLQKLEAVIEEGDLPRSENKILGDGESILIKEFKGGFYLENIYEVRNISEWLYGQICAIREYREQYKEESEDEAFCDEDDYMRNQRFLDAKTLETYGKLKDIEKEAKTLK